jgi:hypothetical protein
VPEEIVGEMVATVMNPPRAGYSRWAMGVVRLRLNGCLSDTGR